MLQSLTALMGSLSGGLTALCAGLWWLWRRARASGQADSDRKALEQGLAQMAAELHSLSQRIRELEAERGRRRIRR